ncbi:MULTISPECIES: 3,4-dihydroxy-2-butanone-4-phosphate synthase [Candidatus Ichthyocystis]|uniref:3,4-dihydroxy-2-butanone 4-phosphate synthase n=1 Tax=Candidatus Ichthyocystis hellenicum TaxID=1561003 RepID=A0A0S4M0P5_9BURK|nr:MULTISPECIES: 3,4-dihydroxy-2-butanone-4-phosphate synthase [Ichthyocystis]CUT17379.1 3,4-dihydroxy-2-butanone 4-phosphate synthase [Candidatus Ichthyocystis hellenicum]
MPVSSIQEVLSDFSAGKMVIIVDDMFRENEGDLVVAADYVTPEIINFMATYGKGLICMPLSASICDRLNFYPMVETAPRGLTAFTVTIDAAEGITTGVSAYDRAITASKVVDVNAVPEDFRRPGHMFPLRAHRGGVLMRSGHTEASVDLCCAAGLTSAAVICEILNDDGSMSRLPELEELSSFHGLKIGFVEDLVDFRLKNEEILCFAGEISLGDGICVRQYSDEVDGCVWCLVYRDFQKSNSLTIDKNFFGEIFCDGDVRGTIVNCMKNSSPEPGMVGVFRLIVAVKGGLAFKDLVMMSSFQVVFKRTVTALSFIATDIGTVAPCLSIDDWKSCFGF